MSGHSSITLFYDAYHSLETPADIWKGPQDIHTNNLW